MIKAAIVGLGWWGRTIARDLMSSDRIRPVLGIDPDENGRKAAAEKGIETSVRFEDALERKDIDAVILCSPHKYHADQIVAAAAAGKHVFCEKPLCTTAAAPRATSRSVGCPTSTATWRRTRCAAASTGSSPAARNR